MPQHVRMHRKCQLCSHASTLNHPQKPCWRYRRSSLGYEYVWVRSAQWPQRPEFRSMQWMHTFNSALSSIDVQPSMFEDRSVTNARHRVRWPLVHVCTPVGSPLHPLRRSVHVAWQLQSGDLLPSRSDIPLPCRPSSVVGVVFGLLWSSSCWS